MNKLQTVALAATMAIACGSTAAIGWQNGQTNQPVSQLAPQRVSGTIATLDHQRGLVTLSSSRGIVKLQFPSAALRNLKEGDRVTTDYSLANVSFSESRAHSAGGTHDVARGAKGGAGTTRDLSAAGEPSSPPNLTTEPGARDLARGSEGGSGTTQDLASAGSSSSRAYDAPRGHTGGTGTTHDLAASGRQRGESTVTGKITDIEHDKGIVHVKTSETILQLHFPPSALRNVRMGQTVTVRSALSPSA